jgi:hypothetical protein
VFSGADTAAVLNTIASDVMLATSASDVMPAVAQCMEMLSCYLGTAGLPAEVLQQHAAVHEQLQRLHRAAAAGAALVSSSTAEQLRSSAQAVMSRIPLSTACNNPGCSNLAQRSELVLVGGKSCVCARCRAARCAAACKGWGTSCDLLHCCMFVRMVVLWRFLLFSHQRVSDQRCLRRQSTVWKSAAYRYAAALAAATFQDASGSDTIACTCIVLSSLI